MTKRANGEGSIRRRPNGRYEGRLTYLDPVTDTRKSVSVYGATAKECRAKLKDIRERVEAGKPAKDSAITVAKWMQTWRTTSLMVSDRKPTTKALYDGLSRKHLESGRIGGRPLDKLRATDVEALIVALRETLSDSSVRQVYTVLRQGLDTAVRDGLIAENPAAKVKRPSVARKEAVYLSPADVGKILTAAQGLRYHLAVLTMALTGMRRGEVAGLLWDQVDLGKGELIVSGTLSRVDGALVRTEPKTERSRRRIPLQDALVVELKAHRARQAAERLRAGNVWVDTAAVFATEDGNFVDPRNILRTVEIAARKAGLDGVRAHTLRHSAAVAMLESGVHIKAVADILGHSSISITGDIYGHTSDDAAKAAIGVLGQALGQ